MENKQSKQSIKNSSSGMERDQGTQDIRCLEIPKATKYVTVTCEQKTVSISFLNQHNDTLMQYTLHLDSPTTYRAFSGNYPGDISMRYTSSIGLIGEIIQLSMYRENGSLSDEDDSE